jgi:hypothetical protein
VLTLSERQMLDSWITREPEYDEPPMPGDSGYPRCARCGGWLKLEPESVERWEKIETCDGQGDDWHYPLCGRPGPHDAHPEVVAEGTTEHRTCKRCGEHQTVACW